MFNKNIILILLLAIFLVSCTKQRENVQSTDNVTIGAILPLTGDMASYGKDLKAGMDLAVEEVNKNHLLIGKKLSIIYEDSQGNKVTAITSINKLISNDKTNIVIGDMFSEPTLAIAPIAERNKVVLLSPTASAIELTNAGDYIFRIYPSDSYDGQFLADFAFENLKAKTAAILFLQAKSTLTISDVFKKEFESKGGKIVYSDSYNEGTKDFRSQILKLKQKKQDIVFIPGYLKEMALLLKQSKELGFNAKFLSISTFNDPKILELAGNSAEGVVFSSPYFDSIDQKPVMKEFVYRYRSKYKTDPNILAAYGYDVVDMAVKALSMCSTGINSSANIKQSLYSIKDFPGLTGKMTFDKNGDVKKELKIMKVENGKFVSY
jgi:branched-chain amino acid transport system substrate-binding protein